MRDQLVSFGIVRWFHDANFLRDIFGRESYEYKIEQRKAVHAFLIERQLRHKVL
jgi:hypothetical protein